MRAVDDTKDPMKDLVRHTTHAAQRQCSTPYAVTTVAVSRSLLLRVWAGWVGAAWELAWEEGVTCLVSKNRVAWFFLHIAQLTDAPGSSCMCM